MKFSRKRQLVQPWQRTDSSSRDTCSLFVSEQIAANERLVPIRFFPWLPFVPACCYVLMMQMEPTKQSSKGALSERLLPDGEPLHRTRLHMLTRALLQGADAKRPAEASGQCRFVTEFV
jgi:hypothetical protein